MQTLLNFTQKYKFNSLLLKNIYDEFEQMKYQITSTHTHTHTLQPTSQINFKLKPLNTKNKAKF